MTTPVRPSAGEMLLRLAQTFCLCTGVLAAILSVSYYIVLPNITKVDVDGTERTPPQIQAYQQELQASLLSMENKRRELILPVQDELYRTLVREKQESGDLLKFWRLLNADAQEALKGTEGLVVFSHLTLGDGELSVEGDVRNVGPRSMTVLAQFMEKLRAESWVKEVANPAYERLTDDQIGVYSPFALHIALPDHE